jgi:hypothetical protein
MYAQEGGGRGAGERGDVREEVGLELLCAVCFPRGGVPGEDYELVERCYFLWRSGEIV